MSDFLVNLVRRGAGLTPRVSFKPSPQSIPVFDGTQEGAEDSSTAAPEFEYGAAIESEQALSPNSPPAQDQVISPRVPLRLMPPAASPVDGMGEDQGDASTADKETSIREQSHYASEQMKSIAPRITHEASLASHGYSDIDSRTAQSLEEYLSDNPINVRRTDAAGELTSIPDKDENSGRFAHSYDHEPRLEPRRPPSDEEHPYSPVERDGEVLRGSLHDREAASLTGIDKPDLRPRRSSEEAILSSYLESEEAAASSAPDRPRVEVRIGRIEVSMNNLRAQQIPQPSATQPRREPQGFGRFALARRHLSRSWY